ncbi:hypothetical protein [Streptomyces sp. NPDC001410]|uniref:hypothetical protein n=1 Tax=Streptomyces sp. NPDC001410 TaxID=3364574 RepID=UPI00367E9239
MLTAFWSGLGGEFARQWAARVLTPAFAFWAGGAATIWWQSHRAGVHRHGLAAEFTTSADELQRLSGLAQVLLITGALLLMAVSAIVAERLTLPLLRLLEGYWSRPRWLRARMVSHRRSRYDHWRKLVDELSIRQLFGTLSPAEFVELRRLEVAPPSDTTRLRELRRRREEGFDARSMADLARGRRFLHHSPGQDALGMPSRLGEILRAAERRPYDKYGLDGVICWYSLWLLLPAETKTALVQARVAVDNSVRLWLWGALFIVWTPWTWWAVGLAVVVPTLAYYVGILGAARLFGDLTGSAFDLYRFRLYNALHLPRPTSPAEERRTAGPRVTSLLWGGLDEPDLSYTDPPDGPDGDQ